MLEHFDVQIDLKRPNLIGNHFQNVAQVRRSAGSQKTQEAEYAFDLRVFFDEPYYSFEQILKVNLVGTNPMQTQNVHVLVGDVGVPNIFVLPDLEIQRLGAPVCHDLLANFIFA